MVVATVTVAPPSLAIRIDGDPFDLTDDELIVAEHLTKHTRIANITNAEITGTMTSVDGHIHEIKTLSLRNAEVEFADKLKVGDKVIVISAQDEQIYYVIDKVV